MELARDLECLGTVREDWLCCSELALWMTYFTSWLGLWHSLFALWQFKQIGRASSPLRGQNRFHGTSDHSKLLTFDFPSATCDTE